MATKTNTARAQATAEQAADAKLAKASAAIEKTKPGPGETVNPSDGLETLSGSIAARTLSKVLHAELDKTRKHETSQTAVITEVMLAYVRAWRATGSNVSMTLSDYRRECYKMAEYERTNEQGADISVAGFEQAVTRAIKAALLIEEGAVPGMILDVAGKRVAAPYNALHPKITVPPAFKGAKATEVANLDKTMVAVPSRVIETLWAKKHPGKTRPARTKAANAIPVWDGSIDKLIPAELVQAFATLLEGYVKDNQALHSVMLEHLENIQVNLDTILTSDKNAGRSRKHPAKIGAAA